MNRIKKIVLATDFSDETRQSYPIAAALAEKFNAKICLVCFVNRKAPAYSGVSDSDHLRSMLQCLQDESRLDVFANVKTSFRRLDRNVSRSLTELEDNFEHDLITTFLHKRSGIEHFFLQDSGDEVFAKSRRPVLAIAGLQAADPLSNFKDVLVPLACSAGLADLRQSIQFLANNFNSRFRFVFIRRNETKTRSFLSRIFTGNRNEANQSESLFASLQTTVLRHVDSEFIVLEGDPVTRIVEHSAEIGSSLVLAGQRGFRPNLCRRIINAGAGCNIIKVPLPAPIENHLHSPPYIPTQIVWD